MSKYFTFVNVDAWKEDENSMHPGSAVTDDWCADRSLARDGQTSQCQSTRNDIYLSKRDHMFRCPKRLKIRFTEASHRVPIIYNPSRIFPQRRISLELQESENKQRHRYRQQKTRIDRKNFQVRRKQHRNNVQETISKIMTGLSPQLQPHLKEPLRSIAVFLRTLILNSSTREIACFKSQIQNMNGIWQPNGDSDIVRRPPEIPENIPVDILFGRSNFFTRNSGNRTSRAPEKCLALLRSRFVVLTKRRIEERLLANDEDVFLIVILKVRMSQEG